MATIQWIVNNCVGADGKWIPGYVIVYWIQNSAAYHSTEDCPTPSNASSIESGTRSQAIAAVKGHICNLCD